MRESEARFRTVANAAPAMIWMSGTDKLCTFFNKVGWTSLAARWHRSWGMDGRWRSQGITLVVLSMRQRFRCEGGVHDRIPFAKTRRRISPCVE
jgi:hypothetical protein